MCIGKCGLPDVYEEVWVSLCVWESLALLMCMENCGLPDVYGKVWPS